MAQRHKMKLPRPYLSYSQFYLYQNDPMEYYQQYYVCRVDEPTPKMLFGKIFQEAWCDKKYDYAKELKAAGFTANYERVIREALSHKSTVFLPKSMTEYRMLVKHPRLNYPVLSIFDGFRPSARLIVENKMGVVWTQERVDTDKQLTWYLLSCKLKLGFVPKMLLQSFNSNNGIPTQYWVKRYQFDFDKLIQDINTMVERLEAGDFDRLS